MEVNKASVLSQFIAANGGTQFVIPTYQRNYVWESKQIKQLMADIKRLINDPNEKKYHYIGSIVYINTSSIGMCYEKTIIDGQQRLTTIFLILQTLKLIALTSGDQNKANSITSMYLENNSYIDDNFKFRLKPLISDDIVYELIAKNKFEDLNSYRNSNVYKAFSVIQKELRNWIDSGVTIDQIIIAIDKLKIVWIQLEKDENPQQVFESINSTGVSLTSADLIRNYILMNKDNETQTRLYNTYWVPIENKFVKTSKLAEFFRFYCAIKEKSVINQRDVYEVFKNEFENNGITDEEQLIEILDYAKYYYYITETCEDAELEEVFKDYRNSQTNMPHLVLMEFYRLYKEEKIEKGDFINSIKLLTSYIVRRNMASLDTKSISQMFPGLLGRILSKCNNNGYDNFYNNCIECIVVDTKGNSQYMPTDEEIIEQFGKTNLYVRDLTKFVLCKIENNDNHISYDNLNIEHIMPQTRTDYWTKYVNDIQIYEQVINRIGNLTLVDQKDNSGMSNSDFITKKNFLYNTRHIKMNEYILEREEWNEKEIIERSKIIARKFNEIFKYPDCKHIEEKQVQDAEYNIIEDNINLLNSLNPKTLCIDNEVYNVDTWTDLYKLILKALYEYNSKKFLEIVDLLNNDVYEKPQISKNASELRAPYMFVEDYYCETNKSTYEKIKLIHRLEEKLSSRITFKLKV